MSLISWWSAGALALAAGVGYLAFKKRGGIHPDRTPPAWVTRILTFA